MPQTITEWWKQHLGDDWQVEHELLVHTLGNLTLTAYNSELSNDTFPKKQQFLTQSHIEINKYFQNINIWTNEEIETRSNHLADLVLQYWPYFGDEKPVLTATSADEVTGKTPQNLIILGQNIPVDNWREVMTKTLNTIAELEPDLFDVIAMTFPRFISKDPEKFKQKAHLNNEYYVNTYLNAKNIYRFCEQAIETIGLTREDWIVQTN